MKYAELPVFPSRLLPTDISAFIWDAAFVVNSFKPSSMRLTFKPICLAKW